MGPGNGVQGAGVLVVGDKAALLAAPGGTLCVEHPQDSIDCVHVPHLPGTPENCLGVAGTLWEIIADQGRLVYVNPSHLLAEMAVLGK